MSISKHIRIATKTGYMWVGLNDGKLLVLFRADENSPSLRTVEIKVQNPKAVYDAGWRIDVLLWLVRSYEPSPRMSWELPNLDDYGHNV